MVRMSDLVRGTAPAAPTPPPPPVESKAERNDETPPTPKAVDATARNRLRLTGLPSAPPPPPPPPATSVERMPPAPAVVGAATEGAAEAAETLFADLQRVIEGVHETIKTKEAPDWGALERRIEAVAQSLAGGGELFWVANRPNVPPGVDYLAFHQARVTVLAMRVGGNTGYDRTALTELGLAGCLIDIGLWLLPSALLRRLEAMSPEELAQYRSHPRLAAELIQRWTPPYAGIAEIVLQHHEREQGQGFPQGLQSVDIRPEAKLLGLIDTYTGLTAPASLRPGLRPHEAVREIVRSKHESFPPSLIKALLSEISVFPPGTLVRLNTGEIGCVIAVNRNHPLRPRIEVFDAKGRRPNTPKTIDLAEAPFLYITGPVAEGVK
ncbi:MAG: hypothetical protein HY216_13165 [Candidatus Rokubacteria bacterium]|nr:hypothetical protein [Candidatus Rokubacteria bacterium]